MHKALNLDRLTTNVRVMIGYDTQNNNYRTCKNLQDDKRSLGGLAGGDVEKDLYLLEELLLAKNGEDLTVTALKHVRRLGFEYFFYGAQTIRESGSGVQFLLHGCLEEWRNRYHVKGYEHIDPLISYSERRFVPLVWNDEFYIASSAATLYQEASAFGLNSGIALPMHGLSGKVAYVNLTTSRYDLDDISDIAATLGNAQLFACYLHEAYQNIEVENCAAIRDGKPLSTRERECLRWAAAGKTSWEISRILNLAERTVVFHLTNATEKLGAINRRQAVVRAIARGLIVP